MCPLRQQASNLEVKRGITEELRCQSGNSSPPSKMAENAAWAPAPASLAAGCTAALPKFPITCHPSLTVLCIPPNSSSTTITTARGDHTSQLLLNLDWHILADHVAEFLELSDWVRLTAVSNEFRNKILSGLSDTQIQGFHPSFSQALQTITAELKKQRFINQPDPPLERRKLTVPAAAVEVKQPDNDPAAFNISVPLGLASSDNNEFDMHMWSNPNEEVSGNLSPSRLKSMERSLLLGQKIDRAPDAAAGCRIGMTRLEIGGEFNSLKAADEEYLWAFLSQCRLEYVAVNADFYHCACACCSKIIRAGEDPAPATTTAFRPVRVTVPAAGGSPSAAAVATLPGSGSPGRTPYRRTLSGRWQRRRNMSITPRYAPASAMAVRRRRRSESDGSPGTSLRVFSGQRSYSLNRLAVARLGVRNPSARNRDEASSTFNDSSASSSGSPSLPPRADSAPRRLSSGGSSISQQPIEQLTTVAPREGDETAGCTGEEDVCGETCRRHAVGRIFWLFRLLLAHRATIRYFDFSSPPACCRTCGASAGSLPEFPAPLRALEGTIEFPQLERLRFGRAIDCRFIVPFVDFCRFDKLRHLEVLGLPLSYTESEPQFGKEPTLVFGPQFIFATGDSAPLWLPAVYNGRIDGQLQLQGRGVYASREYRYEGSFRDGRNEGHGLMASTCGETYRGQWQDGRRHGEGVVTQADGRRLQGRWYKDSLHGRGEMNVSGGVSYDGEWRHGVLDGWGVMSSRDGDLLAFGQFRNGRPHGWVVHRCDENVAGDAVEVIEQEEEEDDDEEDWDVASLEIGDEPLTFPLELHSVTTGNGATKPLQFLNLIKKQREKRLVYRIHKMRGWRGVWKRHEDDTSENAHQPPILLLSATVCKQIPPKIAPETTEPTEIEEAGDPPTEIPFWLDDVLAKLRIEA